MKQVRAHPGRCNETVSQVRNGCQGSHQICLRPKKAVFGRFGSFWGPSGTPRWPSLAPKTIPIHYWGCALTCSTLVSLCSISLEPPDPLMAQKGRFGPFWTLWGPSGTPIWPSLNRKTVPIHHWGCALTCSTLVPLCSTSLEPPDPLMAKKGRFWLFWTLLGGPLAHPYGPP